MVTKMISNDYCFLKHAFPVVIDIYTLLIKLKNYYFKNLLRLPPYNHNNQGALYRRKYGNTTASRRCGIKET